MEKAKIAIKPPTELEKQVEILKNRGLFFDNDTEAIRTLEHINYYRLRGYYIHLQKEDVFEKGVSFNQIVALHNFDSELRLLLLSVLLDVEVVARARISYIIAHAWGAMGYREKSNYSCSPEKVDELMDKLDADLKQSNERFIKTHQDKYGGQFPIWVAVEVMSFGDLSKLYSLLPTSLKKNIANSYDYLDEKLLTNWIHGASVLRNVCAHNGRIYNRSIPTPITIEAEMLNHVNIITGGKFTVYPQSFFAYLLALRRISTKEAWDTFMAGFCHLVQKYDGLIELRRLGIPYQWKSLLIR